MHLDSPYLDACIGVVDFDTSIDETGGSDSVKFALLLFGVYVMFNDIRFVFASLMQNVRGTEEQDDYLCGPVEVQVPAAGPFQKWSAWVTGISVSLLLLALFATNHGVMRDSIALCVLFLSVAHLSLMLWVWPVANRYFKPQLDKWYFGHVQNHLWGVCLSAFIWFFG